MTDKLRAAVLAAAAAAVLAGCSRGAETAEGEAAAEPPATTASAAAPAAAAANDTAAAEAFARSLYARYADGAEPPADDAVYAPELLAQIQRDQQLNNGEVGFMGADPFCQCQDFQDLTVTDVSVTSAEPGRAEAVVAFTNMGESRQTRLRLQRVGDQWRVADVFSPDLPQGMLAGITESNTEAAGAGQA